MWDDRRSWTDTGSVHSKKSDCFGKRTLHAKHRAGYQLISIDDASLLRSFHRGKHSKEHPQLAV